MSRVKISVRQGPRPIAVIAVILATLTMVAVLIEVVFGISFPFHRTPSLKARSAILIDASDGRILFSKKPNAPSFPASTTKILTALVALENVDPEEIITVGNEIRLVSRDSSKAGLKVGDRIRRRDLIAGLMLPSGNDAAYVLAVQTVRSRHQADGLSAQASVARFVRWMNDRAARIGAVHSRFSTPDGYHESDQITTAMDLALIAREAMKIPWLREIAGTSTFSPDLISPPFPRGLQVSKISRRLNGESESAGGPNSRFWENRNKLLDKSSPYYYPGASGIKTGHTVEAGFCLVSSARKNGRELIAVILDSTETGVWKDSIALLDFGFRSAALPSLGIAWKETTGPPDQDNP